MKHIYNETDLKVFSEELLSEESKQSSMLKTTDGRKCLGNSYIDVVNYRIGFSNQITWSVKNDEYGLMFKIKNNIRLIIF